MQKFDCTRHFRPLPRARRRSLQNYSTCKKHVTASQDYPVLCGGDSGASLSFFLWLWVESQTQRKNRRQEESESMENRRTTGSLKITCELRWTQLTSKYAENLRIFSTLNKCSLHMIMVSTFDMKYPMNAVSPVNRESAYLTHNKGTQNDRYPALNNGTMKGKNYKEWNSEKLLLWVLWRKEIQIGNKMKRVKINRHPHCQYRCRVRSQNPHRSHPDKPLLCPQNAMPSTKQNK